jgi:hypothetical protein
MPRPRADARRDYRHFPQEYQELIERFALGGEQTLGPMTLSEARSSVRDLNRYKGFLMRAVTEERDSFAKELLDIFNRAQLRAVPLLGDADQAHVVIAPHPLVTAIGVLRESAEL